MIILHRMSPFVNNRFKGHLLLNYWLDFTNLTGMILIWPSVIIVQMVKVHCISRSHRLKIDFRDETFTNLFCLKAQGLEP